MSNCKNILPYAELVHDASLAGGTDAFKEALKSKGFEACKIIVKNSNTKNSALSYGLAAMVGIGVWELGKFGLRKLNEYIDKPAELKAHRILSQPRTAAQTAAPTPTAVTEATNSAVETYGENNEASYEEEQPLVICEDDLEDQPPEGLNKLYTAMRMRREEDK